MALPQTSHSNHIFLFCNFDAPASGPLLTQRPAPPRAGGFLEPVKDSLERAPFTCKPTNPEPTLRAPPLWGSRTHGHHPPALITPWAGARQPGTAPTPQGPLRFFKLASPNPVYPAPPVHPHRNHSEGSGPRFSVMRSGSGASPCGPQWRTLPSPPRGLRVQTSPLLAFIRIRAWLTIPS